MSGEFGHGSWVHRGMVCAGRGAVAAAHPLAAQAGLRVLREGGNALDACVAAAAVLNVVEPSNSHLGGDVFIQFYSAADRRVRAFNGSGKAPAAAAAEAFPNGMPLTDLRVAAVPGQVSGWIAAIEQCGTWPLRRLLEDAIHYATEGFPVNPRLAGSIAGHAPAFGNREGWRASFLPEGRPPQVGETLKQPALARTLQTLADGGRAAFYEGPIARELARYCRENGGWISEADMQDHATEAAEPIRTTYRGLTISEQPPVSQGLILLEMLNIVEGYDIAGMGLLSAEAIHVMVEAKKLAFADRLAAMGDHPTAPTAALISKEFAAKRRDQIRPASAGESPPPGDWLAPQDTTYLCAADGQGNAVSFIQSLFHGFGCGHMPPALGFMLNNRMTGFSLQPGHPNRLAPGKRPIHTLNTYVVLDGDRLWAVGGTPGGDVQVQTNLQVLTQIIDGGWNAQEAAEAPKWASEADGTLRMENRFPAETIRRLEDWGHRVRVEGPWSGSCAVQLIRVDQESGAYLAGSDPRTDGQAVGY